MALPGTDISVSDFISEMQIGTSYGSGVGSWPISYLSTYLARDGWADVNGYTQVDVDITFGSPIANLCGRKTYTFDLTGSNDADFSNWTMDISFNQSTTYPATAGPNFDASNLNSGNQSNGSAWNETYYDGIIETVQVNWTYAGRPPGANANFNDNNGTWVGSPFPGSATSASSGGQASNVDNCVNYTLYVTT
jgi:hypothetical protein